MCVGVCVRVGVCVHVGVYLGVELSLSPSVFVFSLSFEGSGTLMNININRVFSAAN